MRIMRLSAIIKPALRQLQPAYTRLLAGGKQAWCCLHQAGLEWVQQDFSRLAYLFKYLLAAWIALWIALKMEMDQPATALLTVVIVMHFRSGMVITKSYYRLLGTGAGILFSLLLVAWFAQDRFPFFIAAALWIGLCTAGSLVYRNFQSYGFVLAGYTLCIVGLPATVTPWHTFQIASTRFSEIGVGLLSATLVSELILPQRLWESIQALARNKFADFSRLLGAGAPAGLNPPFIKFMQDFYQLESYRASVQFDTDEARVHRGTMYRLNVAFMAVSTTYVVLQRLLDRLHAQGAQAVYAALQAQLKPLSEAMLVDGHPARDSQEWATLQHAVHAYRAQLATWPQAHSLTDQGPLALHTGHALLQRLADELATYVETYRQLMSPASVSAPVQRALGAEVLHQQVDWLPVTLAAARGALTLLVLGGLWMTIDWPSGILAMTLGVITSTLFAASPNPHVTLRQFALGVVLGIVLVYLSNVFWLTAAHDYVMLCIVISPAIMLTAWLSIKPSTAITGAGLGIAYFLMVGFNQALGDNPVRYFNDSIALMIALAVSGILFSLTDIGGSAWISRRIQAQLRQLVVDLCQSPPLSATAFEMRARDLIQRSGSMQRQQDAESVHLVEALCATLEIGHAVIALQASLAALPIPLQKSGQHTLVLIAHYYRQPRLKNQQQLLRWLDRFLQALPPQATEQDAAVVNRVMTQLHFIRWVTETENPERSAS